LGRRVTRRRRPRRLGDPVVREGGDAETARADPPDRFEHARSWRARLGDLRHEVPAVYRDAAGAAVVLEGRVEGLDRQLTPLEPRPCALLPRGDHDAVDRVRLEAALALVSRDRVQGRILHDATDVEYHRRDRAHGRAPWNIANSRLRYRAGGAR